MSRGELVDAATQVAGNHAHGRMAKQSKCGAWFYKPHVGDARSETELTFYAEVHRSARLSDSANAEEAVEVEEAVMLKSGGEGGAVVDDVDALRAFVRQRIPVCPAVSTSRWDDELEVEGYLRLANLTRGYERPCVIDLKIGVRTWDALHSTTYAEKRTKSEAGTTHESLGFKVCGAQTYDGRGALKRLTREECKQIRMSDDLTKETLLEFMRDPVTGEANTWFWPALISQLLAEPLRELPYRLVGTSLLVVYESGKLKRSDVAPCQDEWNGFCAKETKLEARYIDFCHAVPKPADQQVDENFEGGLKLFQRFVDSL